MSKYDSIKTAADLVTEVQFHGLSTAQDDICRAQDILGNTSIEELARLANDIGRNNDDGEPDPKGSWSSNRKPTQGTFYSIIFAIWNWEDACRFWNEHTNPLKERHDKICAENRGLRDEREQLVEHRDELLASEKEAGEKVSELSAELMDAKLRAEKAEAEVIQLKARLYDLLCKE